MTVKKRAPVVEDWEGKSFCKGKNPDLWDLDTGDPEESTYQVYQNRNGRELPLYRKGQRHCVKDCTVRIQCLRRALTADEPATLGVVRGGVIFDLDQRNKKKSKCLLCGWYIASLVTDEHGKKLPGICWICHRYAKCLNCTRMVLRRPGMDSSYCKYCAT